MGSPKENILRKIRKGKERANLWNQVSEPSIDNFFTSSEQDLVNTFKTAIEKIDGKFLIANTDVELENIVKDVLIDTNVVCFDKELQQILEQNQISFSEKLDKGTNPTGFIACEYLVARLGSVLTSSALKSGRELNIFPEHQVVFAKKEQLIYDIKDAIEGIKLKYETLPSMISFATGPSRTADIEKTLILGAHGPKRLTIIYQNFD